MEPASSEHLSNGGREVVKLFSDDTIIVSLGLAGTGKSTFIQLVTSTEQSIVGSDSLEPFTTSVAAIRSNSLGQSGQKVVLIDTPGIHHKITEDLKIYEDINSLITHDPRIRLAGVIYFLRIEPHTSVSDLDKAFNSVTQLLAHCPKNQIDRKLIIATLTSRSDLRGKEEEIHKTIKTVATAKREMMELIQAMAYEDNRNSALQILDELSKAKLNSRFTSSNRSKGHRHSTTPSVAGSLSRTAHKISRDMMKPEDVIIAVMGPTGTGKSTFISCAARQSGNSIVGHNLKSYTSEVQAVQIKYGDRRVILVDTPGFDDTYLSDTIVLRMLADWLKQTYDNGVKLAGIIYMHRISDNRMEGTPLKNLKMFSQLCGTSAAKSVVLTTTMWDSVSPEVGERREDELKSMFWKDMIEHQAKVARFGGSFESAWRIIGTLSEPVAKEALLLQEEMVNLEKKLNETYAGRTLYRTLQNRLDEEKRLLHQLLIEAEGQKDSRLAAELRAQYEQTRKQLDETFNQIKELKISFGRRIANFFLFKRPQSVRSLNLDVMYR